MQFTTVGGVAHPVGKIVCVGRNYSEHAREMGSEPPAEPVLFLKPSTALLLRPDSLRLPEFSAEVHHEVEVVVRVGMPLQSATAAEAAGAVDAITVGIDLTARDLQSAAKKAGLPWAVAKGFDGSAPVGVFEPVHDAAVLQTADFSLHVNGALRQSGRARDMLFSIPELLAFISARFTLEPGDLVFTGTPAGVAAVRGGDHLQARLNGLVLLDCTVTR